MKNQNDLIMRIVAFVLALIACGIIIYNQPQPFQPQDPEKVPAVKLELPAGTVVRTKGLPGGDNSSSGGAAAPSAAPSMGGGGGQGAAPGSGIGGRRLGTAAAGG